MKRHEQGRCVHRLTVLSARRGKQNDSALFGTLHNIQASGGGNTGKMAKVVPATSGVSARFPFACSVALCIGKKGERFVLVSLEKSRRPLEEIRAHALGVLCAQLPLKVIQYAMHGAHYYIQRRTQCVHYYSVVCSRRLL